MQYEYNSIFSNLYLANYKNKTKTNKKGTTHQRFRYNACL